MKNLLSHGFSIVPIRADKRPACKWKQYQSEPMTETEYDSLFRGAKGGALVCGVVSGNLECVDIDLKYDVSGTLYRSFVRCDSVRTTSKTNDSKNAIGRETFLVPYRIRDRCRKYEAREPSRDRIRIARIQ